MRNILATIVISSIILSNPYSIKSMQNRSTHSPVQNLRIHILNGPEAKQYFAEIAHMRMTLFREFPYLYEGTIEYEKEYLETYFNSPQALIILVWDNKKIVGFSSAIPLHQETPQMQTPFIKKGLDTRNYLYIGEVMIAPEYRGKGILRAFLDIHEDQARAEGYTHLTFMTVERPADHPRTPADYQPLDSMWHHCGYQRIDNAYITFSWPQVDTHQETENTLAVWHKEVNYELSQDPC